MFQIGDKVRYHPKVEDDYVYGGLSREVIYTVIRVDPSDQEIYLKGAKAPWPKFWWRDFEVVK